MLCPNCNTGKAIKSPQLGVLPCKGCQERHKSFTKPSRLIEFTSNEIKEGRKAHFKSIVQKYRGGELSKEFVDAYPERAEAMVKEGVHTKKEIKNAKDVWGDISPMGGIGRTK